MIRIADICSAIQSYHPAPDIELVKRAYIYASYYHANQFRFSGEPYIVHPFSVAKILTELKADDKTVAAGLLHDVVEDTPRSLQEIAKFFGDEVAFLVDGVTKVSFSNVNLDADERQIENLRKMFVFMARDVRVILIKLADRLDNIRTIEFLPEEKRKRIAEETLKIFAPIAHRIGLYKIKTELEDRAFEILYPDAANFIKRKLDEIVPKSKKFIEDVEKTVSEILVKEKIENFKIENRIKGVCSIWEKMIKQGIDIDSIYDIIGFRIIVNTVGECYNVLGILHSYFKPIPGKFKDYIAIPKPNGYKSLHTKVILPEGYKVEFQIRTYQMHKEAEEGIAAHWVYKDGTPISESGLKIFSWLKNVLQLSRETPYYEVKNIGEDIYPDEIYVFTPRGDVKILPRGATVLDFAYAVHSELGERCVGAKVNGKLQPIDYQLRSGDIVEIIKSKNQKPKRAWLNFVVTQRAKSRIKQFISKEDKQVAKEIGETTIKRELRKFGLNFSDLLEKGIFTKVLEDIKVKSIEDLFVYVGMGKFSVQNFLRTVRKNLEILERKSEEQDKKEDQDKKQDQQQEELREVQLTGDLKGVKTRFALCCTPVPGDEIVGYITRGYGIVIHRADCKQLGHLRTDRIVKIPKQSFPEQKEYVSKLRFFTDSPEIISDIVKNLRKNGYGISSILSREVNNKFEIELAFKVKDSYDVEKVMNELKSTKYITDIQRT